ncbi:MAG: NAD(P)/FAD-dependent oxidoreductase, partial [Labilithrix sp.]|nr:NAD(P)/FAD-dependent oxidoreductase [Labilithrix sp.]MCW5834104.1 NAD(P)/FAD-dependent oxidoreductase [Labilithrix sp.]
MTARSTRPVELDAVIVGAGFSGLYMLHRLRALGMRARVVEAGAGVGGTWYWNRYPGARCDSDSVEYSYSFSKELEQEWRWTERFATQPEILRYLEHVADRFDLRSDIQLATPIVSASFDDEENRWVLESELGERFTATFCIMATGCLSTWRIPEIAGQSTFQGASYHTGSWPHEGVDFTGKRVGVIGTGSSGIQSIPIIAEQAKELYVFQRTPNFSVPARNAPLTEEYQAHVRSTYGELRAKARASSGGLGAFELMGAGSALERTAAERDEIYERAWAKGGALFLGSFGDLVVNEESNKTARDFIHRKIRQIVRDPKTAEALLPDDHPLGTKRICVDTDYYATFNRPNVTLVDLRRSPISEITPSGIKTGGADGEEYPVDCIVYATGFDAMTGALLRIDIRGREDRALRDEWEGGPRTYLGLMCAGFPNLFTVTGPGSPSVLSNMTTSIEQHVEWISDCIAHMRAGGFDRIEPTVEAQDDWVEHVNDVAHMTLYPKAKSWYVGANVPGKPQVFMPYVGGVGAYRAKCTEIAERGYTGFVLRGEERRSKGRPRRDARSERASRSSG